MSDEQNEAVKAEVLPTGKSFGEFLVATPPDVVEEISDLGRYYSPQRHDIIYLNTPDLFIHCDSDECQGERFFRCTQGTSISISSSNWVFDFVHYACRNCEKKNKIFSISVRRRGQTLSGSAMKFGEVPTFGPHTPARVITLIGPDRELFLQGRRAENHGMGIGAFSYYRRVVENQKGRIIAEIARVAQRLGAKTDVLEAFKLAEKETQFRKAIDEIKDGIPDVLRIGQHNPLTLLHSALSEGLHEHTDKECLEIAQEIRLVLTELAERISQALKEEAELQTAVSRLLNRRSSN
jgi:hypothetical protein